MNFTTETILNLAFIFMFSGGSIFAYKLLLNVVKDDADRIRMFFWVSEKKWWDGYRALLEILNNTLDRAFGQNLISARSLINTMRIAWVYPYVFIIFLTDTIIQEVSPLEYLALVWATLTGVYLSIKTRAWISKLRAQLLLPAFIKFILVEAAFFPFVGLISILLLTTFNTFIAGFLISDNAAILALFFTLFIAGAGLLWSLIWIIIIIGMTAGIMAGDQFETFINGLATLGNEPSLMVPKSSGIIYGIFLGVTASAVLIAMPLINGIFDWVSWIVSRYLIRRLVRDAKTHASRAVLVHISLDVIAAIILLILVTFSMSFLFLTIGEYSEWTQFADQPWGGSALPITLMICSTLFPTFVHLVMAVLALATQELPGRSVALRMLEQQKPSTIEIHLAAGWIFSSVALAVGVVFFATYAFVWLFEYQFHTSLLSLVFGLTN